MLVTRRQVNLQTRVCHSSSSSSSSSKQVEQRRNCAMNRERTQSETGTVAAWSSQCGRKYMTRLLQNPRSLAKEKPSVGERRLRVTERTDYSASSLPKREKKIKKNTRTLRVPYVCTLSRSFVDRDTWAYNLLVTVRRGRQRAEGPGQRQGSSCLFLSFFFHAFSFLALFFFAPSVSKGVS